MAEADPNADFARQVFDRLILRRTKEECLDLPKKCSSMCVSTCRLAAQALR